jgi:predicted hydrocarbon binding protein/KaiC/GvpD/RAD55 family RecA-like ATPase
MSLAKLQEPLEKSLMLLVGAPGVGKSAFCCQVILNSIAIDRPVIFVTSDRTPADVTELLRERGLGEPTPGILSFVDAFTETVGLRCVQQSDTICANCTDLNSLTIATTELQEKIGRRGILLVIDSLTSPYLFNGAEIIRFLRLFLTRFAAEGNSVVALIDEGCGKEEDLVAMMSVADGVIKITAEKNRQLLNVVKYPRIKPTTIEIHAEQKPTVKASWHYEPLVMKRFLRGMFGGDEAVLRKETGDFVNLFWPNLAHWSGMLWDPKGFPKMMYELNKEECSGGQEIKPYMPWRWRLFFTFVTAFQALGIMPKDFRTVSSMKKWVRWGGAWVRSARFERSGAIEYLEDVSKPDEHYFRVEESSDCWGFENVGDTIASHLPPAMAGFLKGFDIEGGDWNAVETKCIGLGDPHCEFKLVPGEIVGLESSLEKNSSAVEIIHERLIDRLIRFMLDEKPLVERPGLGNEVHLHVVMHAMGLPHLGERYRMAQRMGGAISGKKIGERLIGAGLNEDEVIKRVFNFMTYCKVGQPTAGETIRIRENCESIRTKLFTNIREPSCYFTTGFLNGLYSTVKNQHLREIRCIAAGDPCCEWEIK